MLWLTEGCGRCSRDAHGLFEALCLESEFPGPFNPLYQRIVALIDARGAAVVCEQFMAAEHRKGMSSWQGCSYGIPPR